MKNALHLGCGPIILLSDNNITWENSDFADTESSQSWGNHRKRDFTKPFDDIEDNSIDYILGWHIIEHVGLHEKDGILREWLRVLKPGGKLFIGCPDVAKIAKHIVDRDGPWQDWFICMVNIFGPYNGYVGDYHKWGYSEQELMKLLYDQGYSSATPLSPQTLYTHIGYDNGQKIGFADYNIQLEATK